MLIVNPRRKKQITEFVDRDHAVMSEYYDLLDSNLPGSKMKKEMERLIEEDRDFYDSYLMVADMMFFLGKNREGAAMLREAYTRAIKRIVDCKGRWPREMRWGWLENRHLMRAIEQYAKWRWEVGDTKQALDIFRRLLRANPGDNQGARYSILAINLGLDIESWQKPFLIKEKGRILGLDAGKTSDWFESNAKKFPEEFAWLFKRWKEEGI